MRGWYTWKGWRKNFNTEDAEKRGERLRKLDEAGVNTIA